MDCRHTPMDDDERSDRKLRALFERGRVRVPDQPFVRELARRVAVERRWRKLAARAAKAIAIGTLIAASPWLVSGSAFLSAMLDGLFSSAAKVLDSPYGYGAGLLCFIAAAVIFRRRLLG